MNEENTAQFRTEGTPAFPVENTETVTTAVSPTGEETTTTDPAPEGEQTPADTPVVSEEEKNRGFADDPRWQERENDWKGRFNDQETRHTAEMTKLTASVGEQIQAALKAAGVGDKPAETTTVTPDQIPAWFGGDEQQWAEFSKWNQGLLSQAEQRGAEKAMKGIEEKTQAEQKAIEDATEYMNSEITFIESDKTINPQGAKVDRNKLLKFTIDNDLVDSSGKWNYKAAFRLMQGNAPAVVPVNPDRKQIAAETTSEKAPEVKANPVTTSTDFSKPGARPW